MINKPLLGSQLNLAHFLAKGLVSYWLMSEGNGSIIIDSRNDRNTGVLQNNTHFTAGKFGPALKFDGIADYVLIGTDVGTISNGTFTIAGWINYEQSGIFPIISSTGGGYVGLQLQDSQSYKMRLMQGGSTIGYSTDGVTPSSWQHIAVSYDGTNYKFYINSSPNGGGSNAKSFTPGNTIICKTSASYGEGLIDGLAIWKRVLTAYEIRNLYMNPFAMFEPAQNYLLHAALPSGIQVLRRRRECA